MLVSKKKQYFELKTPLNKWNFASTGSESQFLKLTRNIKFV